MARVKVEDLVKIFPPNVVALDHVTFEVRDGEFFVLLGPSGCGKTTTLRIIAGLETPTSGRVYIDGEDVTDLPPKDRDVAMVFQTWALYPHMKVYDNIAFPLKIRKLPKSEIDRRVREIARLLHIEDLLDRYPRQLSGGQQQRVALARALVRKPKVWLLDEPLSNLDALLRMKMRAELKRLQREFGVTTIYVTHDQIEAMTLADRIAVMNRGRIMQIGTPHEIYNRPANTFVATFVGTPPMNLLRCSVREDAEGVVFEGCSFKYIVRGKLARALRERLKSSEVFLGFRPEHASLSTKSAPNAIPGVVWVIEPLGSEFLVNVKVGEEVVKVRVKELPSGLKADSTVFICIDQSRIYVFDARTGEAII